MVEDGDVRAYGVDGDIPKGVSGVEAFGELWD